jgi:16S rRNA (adenine1518-N6/adenine1519-N6)-dimethyltransferase
VESDVLRVDFSALVATLAAPRIRVVGNLPYNISSPILFHLLDHVAVVQDQHFMLQKEVIDRMVAAPATADYGRLSVMLQWRYAMENVLFVPPESFDPPPRVDSAVVRMVPLSQPPAIHFQTYSDLVQTAFSQRRKILRNTLGKWMRANSRATSICSAVPKKCRYRNTSRWLRLCSSQCAGMKKPLRCSGFLCGPERPMVRRRPANNLH